MPATFLATKFLIPFANARHVLRGPLLASLDESLQRRLTVVSAPAGFGKTLLLSDWSRRAAHPEAQSLPAPVAWVTLDEGDNDPMRFWGYVFTALNRVPALKGTASAALAITQDASSAAIEPALANLINALAERPALPEIALVLDDYHVINALAVHDSLAYLLEHLPPNLHLILLSRADPPLPLARWRARGQLLELRAHDLRFTSAEASTLLNDLMGLALSPKDVANLEERTEGWIVGLHLAALSLQARGAHNGPHDFIREFSGSNRFVLEFLTDEVLSHHPPAVRQFLERGSILQRLSASLCEAVTGQAPSAETLAYLQHHNLFIEPLDDIGEWYRLHPLLAEALQAQLRRAQPDLIPELHRRAREWHAQQGHLHEAMRHALAGGDSVWCADIIEREYRRLLAVGEMMTLRHWLDALPEAVISTRPKTRLAYAWALGYSGRYHELERHLQQAEAALTSGEDLTRGEILGLRAITGALRGVPPAQTMETAQQALRLIGDQDALAFGMAHQALGHAYRMRGLPVEAEREYTLAFEQGAASSQLTVLGALLRIAQVQIMRGHLHLGVQSLRQHIELAGAYGGQVRFYAGEAHIRLGDLYREWNQLDTALAHVQEGMELARRVDNAVALAQGYFTLAHVHAARGEPAQVQAALQRAEQCDHEYDFQGFRERVACHRLWLTLAESPLTDALAWAEAYAVRRLEAADTVHDFADLLLARVWRKAGRAAEALALLQELAGRAEAAERSWTLLQTWVLQTLACQALSDPQAASTRLNQALKRAEPEGYIRLFVDEGKPVQIMLSEHARWLRRQAGGPPNQLAYVERLLSEFEPEAFRPAPAGPPRAERLEPLSAREEEVLRLMARGASNRLIAETLVISVGTVKSHINRILGKLGAHNRTEAVMRAQASRLL
jgi:LuxR family maltose regulon positive regulatory protein